MRFEEIVRFKTIRKTFLIPTLIFTLISFVGLGTVLVRENSAALQFVMESKGKATADLLQQISAGSVRSNDFSVLESYVKQTLKDPDVVFIVFYDAEKKPLTENSREPKDIDSLFIQEREIRSTGENRLLGYLKLGFNQDALSNHLQSGIVTVAISTLALLTLLSLGIIALAGGISQPLRHLVEITDKMSRGDLAVEVETTVNQRDDEVGILAHSFSKMSDGLKGGIKKIQELSHQMTYLTEQGSTSAQKIRDGVIHQGDATTKSSSSLEEMSLSMNRIAENIGHVSSSAEDNSYALGEMSAAIRRAADSTVALSTSVEETAASLLGMSSTIKEVAEHIDTLLLYAEEATASVSGMNASIEEVEKNAKESALLAEKGSQEAAELGMGVIEQTIGGMEQIKKSVQKSSHIIYKLEERAKKIGNILTVIDGVTRQTNMLALNASILAAQAGNEGKGFSVVSDEMKNLADRTEASTTEIAQLIRDVQSDTTDAVVSVKEGLQSVEEGVRRSAHARESLNKIIEISERSSTMSRHIEKATLEQVKATNQMTQLMEKVSVMVMKINTAMSELENGTFNITRNSQKMNTVTQQVQTDLEEQAKGSMQISGTGEGMRIQMQQIAAAMTEQKKGTEILMNSIVEIQQITEVNLQMTEQMNQAMNGLAGQTDRLKNEVQHFGVEGPD